MLVFKNVTFGFKNAYDTIQKYVLSYADLFLKNYLLPHINIYALMCEIYAYETEFVSDSVRSGNVRPMSENSNTDIIQYLCVSINFIYSWLK